MEYDFARRNFYFSEQSPSITIRRASVDPSGKKSHQHDLTLIPHLHQFKELVIVTKGEGTHCVGRTRFPVAAGDVFLIHEGQEHHFASGGRLELVNVMYVRESLDLPESDLNKIPGYSALFILEPAYRKRHRFKSHLRLDRAHLLRLLRIVGRMEEEERLRLPGYGVLMYSHFLEAVAFVSRAYSAVNTREAKPLLRLGEVIGLLESQFTKDWTIPELLEVAHMSRSNFMRLFRKATGQTVIEYLANVRVQEAIRLLSSTDWSVTRIAGCVGFADSNYFTRRFREITGTAPSEFR